MKETNSIGRIKEAVTLAKRLHAGQVRKGPKKEAFFNHPRRVCKYYLAFKHKSVNGMVASLCHDLIEDTPLSIEELEDLFGPQVRKIVWDLTKPDTCSSDEYAAKIGGWTLESKKIKLCDIEDNILSSRQIHSGRRVAMLVKWRKYLQQLGKFSSGELAEETEMYKKWSAVNELAVSEWNRLTAGSDFNRG
jgi:(p)ppGpp synthase/HD superfamily hydrolase